MRLSYWTTRLGADALVFLGPTSVFLFAYVQYFAAPAEVVTAHLRVFICLFLGVMTLRLIIARCLPQSILRDLATALALAVVLGLLLIYYIVVLIGLKFWGRVISWDLIVAYSSQMMHLLEVLEVALSTAFAVIVFFSIGLLATAWSYIRAFDWTATVVNRASPAVLVSVIFGGGSVSAIELYSFLAYPPTAVREPFSLTFFPRASLKEQQGLFIDPMAAARQDRIEDQAREAYVPRSGLDATNVILVVVDALRADHMGVYDYGRDTTPFLSSLHAEGRLQKVVGMRATCSSSICGLTSLLTSKFVHQFSHRPFSLHEALKRHGYAIHMILGGDHTRFYGLREVYGAVDSYYDGGMDADKQGVSFISRQFPGYANDDRLVMQRLAEFPKWNGTPVMMQFHLMSAHGLGKRLNPEGGYQPASVYWRPDRQEPVVPGQLGGQTANYYDNGVLQTDSIIKSLLQTLESKGYLHRAVVVITADHGEGLGEHGIFQHAQGVYEEMLRVPFIMIPFGYQPDRPLRRIRGASQIDVAPTILAEIGMPRPETWVGSPLQDGLQRDFTLFQEQEKLGLVDHRDPKNEWKYWLDITRGKEFAFNLSVDSHEKNNLFQEIPRELRREWRSQVMAGAPIAADSQFMR